MPVPSRRTRCMRGAGSPANSIHSGFTGLNCGWMTVRGNSMNPLALPSSVPTTRPQPSGRLQAATYQSPSALREHSPSCPPLSRIKLSSKLSGSRRQIEPALTNRIAPSGAISAENG